MPHLLVAESLVSEGVLLHEHLRLIRPCHGLLLRFHAFSEPGHLLHACQRSRKRLVVIGARMQTREHSFVSLTPLGIATTSYCDVCT